MPAGQPSDIRYKNNVNFLKDYIMNKIRTMKLYEVQATEYNGEQEYSQSNLIAAKNIKHARQLARDYFGKWYDDGDKPRDHNTGDPDEFEFICGSIRISIKSVRQTTVDEWLKSQIALHSISELPDELMTTPISRASAELLEACRVLTSYTTDLLYRLDNQVNISDVEEIQQAKAAIAKFTTIVTNKS